jgi:hypothetical protein
MPRSPAGSTLGHAGLPFLLVGLAFPAGRCPALLAQLQV